jgi:hypothetical protein
MSENNGCIPSAFELIQRLAYRISEQGGREDGPLWMIGLRPKQDCVVQYINRRPSIR